MCLSSANKVKEISQQVENNNKMLFNKRDIFFLLARG